MIKNKQAQELTIGDHIVSALGVLTVITVGLDVDYVHLTLRSAETGYKMNKRVRKTSTVKVI